MNLLGVDAGTTHCKAGVFAMDGAALALASRPTITRHSPEGWAYFDPDELWESVAGAIQEALARSAVSIEAVGIASMAETGILLDRRTGQPRSFFVPWFDTSAQSQAEQIQHRADPVERFRKTGMRATFKCGLAKILWLRERDPGVIRHAVWLSAADYIAYRLTGARATDLSLAGRTCAFQIDRKQWDAEWLREWGLPSTLFPPAAPSGQPIGRVASGAMLPAGTRVAITGHDHVCGAFAAGAIEPGRVFDSMGTAEGVVGGFAERPLTDQDFESGLMYGCHAARGTAYWMGGLSASGGSVEWLRAQLGAEALPYAELEALLATAPPDPSGILYFPYLLGSGSPHQDAQVRGALIGLSASHGRADLLKAVLEGTAFEIEFIRRAGEKAAGRPIETLIAAGGGTRLHEWMQIRADVTGCRIEAMNQPEATCLGAALLAGVGCGLYAGEAQALASLARATETWQPDPHRHAIYRRLYEQGYCAFQTPLRQLGHGISGEG